MHIAKQYPSGIFVTFMKEMPSGPTENNIYLKFVVYSYNSRSIPLIFSAT